MLILEMVSCGPGWLQTHYVTEDDLKPEEISWLFSLYIPKLRYPAYALLRVKPTAMCVSGKPSITWPTSFLTFNFFDKTVNIKKNTFF